MGASTMDKPERSLMKKTKAYQYLEGALLILMEEKKYEEITVRDLVNKAGISRTAFYSQFTCKQDFVAQVIEHTHRGATIIATNDLSMDLFSEENFVAYYTRFYRYVASKHRLYRAMLGQNGLPEFREQMRAEAMSVWKTKHFTDAYLEKLSPPERNSCEVMLSYIISAHIGLIEYWLENGMKETPEYMAGQLYHMTWLVLKERTLHPTV